MKPETSVPYRPLGLIINVLEKVGFSSSHVYDDLIFANHNAFILKMEKDGADISLLFNQESDVEQRDDITLALEKEGVCVGLNITYKGLYRLSADEEKETINIAFME